MIADYRTAPLSPAERMLLDWCVKLTRTPGAMTAADVDALRAAGWTDDQVTNAAMVCGYFNFINRIADGLGIDLEPSMEGRDALPPCPW